MIAPAGHHCNVRSGHLNATFGGKDMGSMAQTGLLLVPSDALGHTWALPGVLGAGQGLPPESGPGNLKRRCNCQSSAAALASLAARSSAAAPSPPVGPRRLAAAVRHNVTVPAYRRCHFLADFLLNQFVDKLMPELLLLD